jgi:hypothetical protein
MEMKREITSSWRNYIALGPISSWSSKRSIHELPSSSCSQPRDVMHGNLTVPLARSQRQISPRCSAIPPRPPPHPRRWHHATCRCWLGTDKTGQVASTTYVDVGPNRVVRTGTDEGGDGGLGGDIKEFSAMLYGSHLLLVIRVGRRYLDFFRWKSVAYRKQAADGRGRGPRKLKPEERKIKTSGIQFESGSGRKGERNGLDCDKRAKITLRVTSAQIGQRVDKKWIRA